MPEPTDRARLLAEISDETDAAMRELADAMGRVTAAQASISKLGVRYRAAMATKETVNVDV